MTKINNAFRRKLKTLLARTKLVAVPTDDTKTYKCSRLKCGHEWEARQADHLPKRCPNCFSPAWNKVPNSKLPSLKPSQVAD